MTSRRRWVSRSGVLGGLLLGLVALATPASAEAPTTTRVDLFDKSSNRTGAAIIDEKSGRIDFYDRKSNRTGYGTIDRKSGRLETYDTKSNRTGSGQRSTGVRK
jgi:hypothetical protein